MLLIFVGVTNPLDTGGSGISGGYFSKGKWHALKKEIAEERAEAHRVLERERRAEDLTALERAQRELRRAEKAFAKADAAFFKDPSRPNLESFRAARERLNLAKEAVERLENEKAHAQARAEREREQAAKEAARLARRNEIAVEAARRAAEEAKQAATSIVRLHGGLANVIVDPIAIHAMQEAAKRAALEDDDEALGLLL